MNRVPKHDFGVLSQTIGKHWPEFDPLSEADRQIAQEWIDEYADRYALLQEQFFGWLRAGSRRLARKVARDEMSMAEANDRLRAMCERQVPDCPVPLHIVPTKMALATARKAFKAAGVSEMNKVAL